MRTSFLLAGLGGSLVLLLFYFILVPVLSGDPLPIQSPAYRLGEKKRYSPYEESPYRPLQVVFNQENSRLFTSRGNGTVEEWELNNRSQVNAFRTNDVFSYVAPKNSLVTKNVDDHVGLLMLDTKQVTPIARDFYVHSAVDGSGKFLLLSTGGSSLEMWKTETRTMTKKLDTHMPVRNGMAISSDGRYVAAAEGAYDPVINFHSTAIQLWDLKTKNSRLLFEEKGERKAHGVWGIKFSPDGTMVAVDTQVLGKSGVTVWNVQTGDRIFEVEGFESYWVRALTFSPGGKYLASGDERGNLVIWSLDLQKDVWRGQVEGQVIHSIAFSSDGQRLAAGIQDSRILIWDIQLTMKDFV